MFRAFPLLLSFAALSFGGCSLGPADLGREFVSVVVMMNSNFSAGRGPSTAPCLVMFDLDQAGPLSKGKVKMMKGVADKVYDFYSGDRQSDGTAEMDAFVAHLEDDTYRPHHRKAVPKSLTGGRRFYVSDIMLHRNHFGPEGIGSRVAMIKATGEERGTTYQVPWNPMLIQ